MLLHKVAILVVGHCFLSCLPHSAASPSETIEFSEDEHRLMAAMESYSSSAIPELEKALLDKRDRYRQGRISKQIFKNDMAYLKRKLSVFTKQPKQMPLLNTWDLKTGAIGVLVCGISSTEDNDNNRFEILQVVDAKNMIITTLAGIAVTTANYAAANKEMSIWVTGTSTEGLTDGEFFQLNRIYEVKGTRQYRTAIGGTKTIVEISPFPIQDVNAFRKRLKLLDAQQRKIKQLESFKKRYHKWTIKEGETEISARYVRCDGTEVVLATKEGETINVLFSELSESNQRRLNRIDPNLSQ